MFVWASTSIALIATVATAPQGHSWQAKERRVLSAEGLCHRMWVREAGRRRRLPQDEKMDMGKQ